MSNCKKFSIVVVDNIVPGRNGMVVVGSSMAGSTRISNLVWTNYTSTGTATAASIIGGGIGNTGAGAGITLTLPNAADVLTAIEDAGIAPYGGMTFTLQLTALAAFSLTVSPSASITFDNAAASLVLPSQKSASLLLRVTSITSGAEAIVIDSIVGN